MSKRGTNDDFKQEVLSQAVVLTDSYDHRFHPITSRLPRCLMPIANVPILHYTLTQVISSGIEEIIIYCSSHQKEIKKFIKERKYAKKVNIKVAVGEGTRSLGDALRDLDSQRLIQSDFLIVHGDLLTNVDLGEVIKKHKLRREKNHAAIMTIVLKEVTMKNRIRQFGRDNVAVGIENDEKVFCFSKSGPGFLDVNFDSACCQSGREPSVRFDLVDPNIAVCSASVPPLFQDNFDFCSLEDIITDVITNEEILNNSVHVEIVRGFAHRVKDMFHYMAMGEQILDRCVFPHDPMHTLGIKPSNSVLSPSIYISQEAVNPRDTKCVQRVLVGPGTKIGADCCLENVIIGKNCKIGDNVVLKDVVVWDNVTIGDDCEITCSLLCHGVEVQCGSTILGKSVLSFDVTVGPDARVKERSVLVCNKGDAMNEAEKGKCSNAFLFRCPFSSEEGELNDGLDDSDFLEEYEPIWTKAPPLVVSASVCPADTNLDESFGSDEKDMDPELFLQQEVQRTLERAMKEDGIKPENVILEVNSLKHAYNVPIDDLYFIVSKALVDFPFRSSLFKCSSAVEYFTCMKQVCSDLRDVLKSYLKTEEAKRFCLQALEDSACEQPLIMTASLKLLDFLYNEDILSEEAILWWKENSPMLLDEDMREKTGELREILLPFFQWLEDAEEESD